MHVFHPMFPQRLVIGKRRVAAGPRTGQIQAFVGAICVTPGYEDLTVVYPRFVIRQVGFGFKPCPTLIALERFGRRVNGGMHHDFVGFAESFLTYRAFMLL